MSPIYSTVGIPEDQAYLTHHFACPTCCAAGRTPGHTPRCPRGLELWAAYEAAMLARDQIARKALAPASAKEYPRP